MPTETAFPDNPVLVQVIRGGVVESQHRGAWVLTDAAGRVLEGVGSFLHPIFARSSIKSLQALPLLESGAAERFGVQPAELALAVASHNAELGQTARVSSWLQRLELDPGALQCGAQQPTDTDARQELLKQAESPSALHNNCSGKHTGFLTLSKQLDEAPEHYLEFESATQVRVRAAVGEMTDLAPEDLGRALDGCSAPTFRVPLQRLAMGLARLAEPSGLAPERRRAAQQITAAVREHPDLIAGHQNRLCTALSQASEGKLFPKIGAEGVYVIGVCGEDRGLAVKMDDGSRRGLRALVLSLLKRFDLLSATQLVSLSDYRQDPMRNWAGREVGRVKVLSP